MTTEYRIELDRAACDGIFACLVRDGRFVEADDGLATIESGADDSDSVVDAFDDDRLADAQQAAEACPVGAITVEVSDDE
ncbi:ferredoxin [Salinibaculum rarum]|uniref:ferredoxin n=1 Tax=Salinibaculum rarum TaxID=3058903 RepID=UPI00265F8079|nr:ferredoxin [Salinibaculum sp. KK48]